MLNTIGNHDIGWDALSNATVEVNNAGPLFFAFFPQHLDPNTGGIPAISDRVTNYYHIVGNSAHITLDSGYFQSYGSQVAWLEQTLQALSPYYSIIVNYHNPIYPGCTTIYDNPGTRSIPKEIWVPLFDKYNVQVVFENHVHLFKVTYPLTNSSINQDGGGIIYIGDGNIGVYHNGCPLNGNETGLINYLSTENHIWIVNVSASTVSLEPWSVDGQNVMNISFVQPNNANSTAQSILEK